MALNDARCRATKPKEKLFKLSDGCGLQFWIQPNGSKLWRYAYTVQGKQRTYAIGKYPEVSLADARAEHLKARAILREGKDPVDQRRRSKLERASAITFADAAKAYIEHKTQERKADATIKKLEWLLGEASTELGKLPIKDISTPDVLRVVRPFHAAGNFETAKRLRSVIGAVFRQAVIEGIVTTDPTYAMRGWLGSHVVKHHAAIIDPAGLGGLLRAIDGYDGQPSVRAALQLMALFFPRPGELRKAYWPEFDLNQAVWSIPAERMKMRRAHRVPLSRQAIIVLGNAREISRGGELVLDCFRSSKNPMSENTMNAALRRLGYSKEEMTSHGFRASAATLLNQSALWTSDAVERQLGHGDTDGSRRPYARGDYWDERVRMMQWWADYLDQLRANVPDRAQLACDAAA